MSENIGEFTVNDGKGLFDKYGLINTCIKTLCGIKVRVDELSSTGTEIVDVINRLYTLSDGLKNEEEIEKKHREERRNG